MLSVRSTCCVFCPSPYGESRIIICQTFARTRPRLPRSLVHDLETRMNVDTTICANDKIPNVTEEPLPLARRSPTRPSRCESRATAEFLYCSNCVNPQVITPLILIYSQDTRLIYYCIFSLLFTLLLSFTPRQTRNAI